MSSVPALLVVGPDGGQALGVGQDTPSRLVLVAPLGLGVVWMVQLVPFQASARVSWVPALVVVGPCGGQALGVGQDML